MKRAIVLAIEKREDALLAAMAIRYAESGIPSISYRRIHIIVCGHRFDGLFPRAASTIDYRMDVHPRDFPAVIRSLPAEQTLLQTQVVRWDKTKDGGPSHYFDVASNMDSLVPVYGMLNIKTGVYDGQLGSTWIRAGNTLALGPEGPLHGLRPLFRERLDLLAEYFSFEGQWLPSYYPAIAMIGKQDRHIVAIGIERAMDQAINAYAREYPLLGDYMNIGSAITGWYPFRKSGGPMYAHMPLLPIKGSIVPENHETRTTDDAGVRKSKEYLAITSMPGESVSPKLKALIEGEFRAKFGYGID